MGDVVHATPLPRCPYLPFFISIDISDKERLYFTITDAFANTFQTFYGVPSFTAF